MLLIDSNLRHAATCRHIDIDRVSGATRHRRERDRVRGAIAVGEIARLGPGPGAARVVVAVWREKDEGCERKRKERR